MKAFMSTYSTDCAMIRACADGGAQWAENEARAILSHAEPTLPGPFGYMAHPGCFVEQAGIFCADCMTPLPKSALAEALSAFVERA